MISGDTYGVLQRLILNEKITPSPEGVLRTLGFVHLYTASGLHLIALESLIEKNPFRTLKAKKVLTVFFWFFLFCIWKVQGFRLGFARILILFFLRTIAREKGLKWRVYFPLIFTFCFDSIMGIDSGWKHYYLAILGGMLGMEAAKSSQRGWLLHHVYLSVGSWLLTAPLDLFENHVISWVTPFWSLLTIPVISVFLYPLSVFFYFTTDEIPHGLVKIWNSMLEALFHLVDRGLTFLVVDKTLLWIALAASLLFFFIPKFRMKFSLVVFFVLIYRFYPAFHPHDLKLVQLDVGQGDSLLIHKDDRVELVDLGPSERKHPERSLLRLARQGITKVDSVLLTHLDEDHVGGLKTLLPWIPISTIQTNSHFSRTEKIRNWLSETPGTRLCWDGCFKFGNVDWISRHLQTEGGMDGNQLMGMVMIPYSKEDVYLALGDADIRQEELFWSLRSREIKKYPRRILKLSHHGSKNSSSENFLKNISPTRVVISVGRKNRYHHPHGSVLDRLHQLEIPVHRTDQDGDDPIGGEL